ncbi:phage tail protein [Salipaludibacillus sp. CF4.18]|uniref:phage tail protein n=1 Tax=Salipaludibacillus sp. CF4.18 TaxID=3373081 RepID=UPI003EE5C0F6
MLELFKLAGRIDLNGADEAGKTLDDIDGKGQGLSSRFGGVAKTVAKGAAVMGAAIAAAGVATAAAMVKYGNYADKLLDTAAITGMSTDEMQKWSKIATDAGVDTDIMTNSLATLNGQLERGNELSPRLAKGFDAMGISAEEFKKLSPDEQMRKIVEQMMELEGADRRAFANQMNMADMLPLIAEMEASGMELDEIMNEIDVPFSEDDLNKMNEFRKAWDNFKRMLFEVLGQALMPLFEWFSNNMPLIQEITTGVFSAIGEAIGFFKELLFTVIETIQQLFESNQTSFIGIKETVLTVFGEVVEFLRQSWLIIQQFWQENGQQILEKAMEIFRSVRETVVVALTAVWEIFQQILGLVVPFVQEKLQVLQQFWQGNGTQIMQSVQKSFSFIQKIIQTVMPVIQFIIQSVWGIIQGIINGALNIIMGLIKIFSGALTGDWSKMWEGVKQLLSGALQFIWNLISITLVGRAVALIRSFASLGLGIIRNLGPSMIKIFQNMMTRITSIISNLFSRVTRIFTNLRSTLASIGSRILTTIRKPFDSALRLLSGMKSKFLSAGKNIIESVIGGITGSIGKVKDAVGNVAKTIRGFFPFSEPKEGPMRGITKIDFGGTIGEAIDGSEDEIRAKMNHMLMMPEPSSVDIGKQAIVSDSGSRQSQSSVKTSSNDAETHHLLSELIQAVKDGKNLVIDKRVVGKVLEETITEEQNRNKRRRDSFA